MVGGWDFTSIQLIDIYRRKELFLLIVIKIFFERLSLRSIWGWMWANNPLLQINWTRSYGAGYGLTNDYWKDEGWRISCGAIKLPVFFYNLFYLCMENGTVPLLWRVSPWNPRGSLLMAVGDRRFRIPLLVRERVLYHDGWLLAVGYPVSIFLLFLFHQREKEDVDYLTAIHDGFSPIPFQLHSLWKILFLKSQQCNSCQQRSS